MKSTMDDHFSRDDDALLDAVAGLALEEGRPEVGGDGGGLEVGAVEPNVDLRTEPPGLVLDAVARGLKLNRY